jgi:hypothetical protein
MRLDWRGEERAQKPQQQQYITQLVILISRVFIMLLALGERKRQKIETICQ